MAEAAAVENFEEAARYRDLVHSIEVTVEKQKMVVQGGDMDVLGLYRDGDFLEIAVLIIRGEASSAAGPFPFPGKWMMPREFHPF